MKISFTFFFFLLVQVSLFGQTIISGHITDKKNTPIAMANVYLKDTYDGATCDENGNFSFSTTEKGTVVLIAKFIGYKEFQKVVNITSSSMSFDFQLHEETNELEAVTISAGSFTASDESRRTVFRALDIATTAGATADIAGALNTLPGTQKVGESGRLFVRGGDSNETRTFIDGMVVLDAYSPSAPNTPSRGRFLPFMFKGTSFSTGGYSAEYGQALSSALALDSKDGIETTRTDVGILSVGGDVAHTQAWDNGSAAAKIQYTNLQPYMGLISQRVDWRNAPSSIEGVAAIRQKLGAHGIVKAYGNFNHSNFSLRNHSIDDYSVTNAYDLTNDYKYMTGFYKNSLNDNWILRGGVSYTSIRNGIVSDGNPIDELQQGIHGKAIVEGSLTDNIELKSGVEVIRRDYDQTFYHFDETITSLFSEADVYANNKFVTRVGGRVEYNSLQNKLSVDPRISLAYKTGVNGQFSFAYGNFRQSAKNDLLRIRPTLRSEQAQHFILNYQHIDNDRTFRVETYYKSYTNLVKIDATGLNNSGSGYARGVEFFWRDKQSIKKLDYWISYSLLDTKRDYLNFPASATPTFASKHNFSVVGKYFVAKIKSQLGATWSFASGRPYNNPNEELFNHGRTPSYQDLSFNWSYLPKPHLIIYFSCTNVLGHKNIFGYEYSNTRNEDGFYNSRTIQQPAPRFVFVGVFITLSKDKSVNQLPSL
jgi:hypothetical protein